MGVTLAADDLTAPEGRLQSAMFPDGDMTTNVTEWLSRATAKVLAADIDAGDHDDAARAWVYHLAYSFVAERMLAEPEQHTTEDGERRTLSMRQISRFERLAAQFKDEYVSYVNEAPAGREPQSHSVSIAPRW